MTNSKFIFTLLAIAMSATFALGQPKPFRDGGNQDGNNERSRWMKALGLSQEQFQKIRTINKETRPSKRKAGIQLRQARQRLSEAIYADDVNEGSVRTSVNSVVEAQSQVTRINAMHELKVRQVLTGEQLVKFRQLRKRVKQRRRIRANPRNQTKTRRPRRGRPPNNDQPRPSN